MKTPRTPVFVVLSVVLAALVFFLVKGFTPERIAGPGDLPAPIAAPEGPAARATMKVTLFFLRDDGLFVAETRDVPSTGSVAADAEAVLNELIKGSANGLVSAIPPETKLRQVFLTKDGTAYADFTKDLAAAHPSGSDAETATIYAIVDTLAVNFKAVKKVFILVEGLEKETLNGHATLDRPYRPDYTLIAKS